MRLDARASCPQLYICILILTKTPNHIYLSFYFPGAIYDTVGTYVVFSWICVAMEAIAVVFYQLYPVGKRLEERKAKKATLYENHTEKVA